MCAVYLEKKEDRKREKKSGGARDEIKLGPPESYGNRDNCQYKQAFVERRPRSYSHSKFHLFSAMMRTRDKRERENVEERLIVAVILANNDGI